MDKFMSSAYSPKLEGEIKRLPGTGIKLRVTEKDTGKEVNYGVQLNNTTLEIEALPTLIVKVYRMQLCLRCNYEWLTRLLDREPVSCPRCRSRKWNVPRKV